MKSDSDLDAILSRLLGSNSRPASRPEADAVLLDHRPAIEVADFGKLTDSLAEDIRLTVTLVYVENCSIAEVAQALDVEPAVVLRRLTRAFHFVARQLLGGGEPAQTSATAIPDSGEHVLWRGDDSAVLESARWRGVTGSALSTNDDTEAGLREAGPVTAPGTRAAATPRRRGGCRS